MEKTFIYVLTICLIAVLGHAQTERQSKTFSKRKENVIDVLKKHVENGLPGVAVAYYSEQEGGWAHSEGFSNLERKIPLENADLHYLQSVTKTYMAVAILKLMEEQKINLEDDISKYLNVRSIGELTHKGITIRMLLNHTSGISDYATNPMFMAFVMSDLSRHFKVQECIDHIKNEPVNFEPGTDYAYSNTNYVLLSMIADKITGSHVRYINTEILAPLGLRKTFYLTKDNYLNIPGIVDSYWDVLNIEKPINITPIQKVNVSSLRGDDGMVCTSQDAIKFLKGLMEGKLLKEETLALMQEWVLKDGNKRYGLGLSYYDLGATYGIGHSGGGIGAGCVLMYLPELHAYVFMATNFSTLIEGKIVEKSASIQTDILSALFL